MTQLSDWQTLLAVQAGAAATLTGLVFVAVSINLSRIIAFPGLASRAAESVGQFLQVFFICTAALIPRQPIAVLGIEILSIALFSWAMQLIALIQHSTSGRNFHPHLWLVIRIAQTQLPSIPLFVAGVYLLLGLPTGLYWLVPRLRLLLYRCRCKCLGAPGRGSALGAKWQNGYCDQSTPGKSARPGCRRDACEGAGHRPQAARRDPIRPAR